MARLIKFILILLGAYTFLVAGIIVEGARHPIAVVSNIVPTVTPTTTLSSDDLIAAVVETASSLHSKVQDDYVNSMRDEGAQRWPSPKLQPRSTATPFSHDSGSIPAPVTSVMQIQPNNEAWQSNQDNSTNSPTPTPGPWPTATPYGPWPTVTPPVPTDWSTATPVWSETKTEDLVSADNRTSILVLGVDRRPGESYITRTDAMILFSVDHDTNQAVILSIPRDLYVHVHGFGMSRINTAYARGAINNTAEAGATLAMRAVENSLHIPVDHYLIIDFSAFTQVVDAIGGVTVDVPDTLYDPTYPDMNYGYDPFYLAKGRQHLDGRTALKYVRTRHVDSTSGREWRQQNFLLGVKAQLLNLGIPKLVSVAPDVFTQIREGIRTDLTVEDAIALGKTSLLLQENDIRTGIFDYRHLQDHVTGIGEQVFLLKEAATKAYIDRLFGLDS